MRGKAGRAVREIGEALPVADEASRFRGSAPIGGHDSGRESVGTTVGNRRPLRRVTRSAMGRRAGYNPAPTEGYKRCGAERNPSVTASPCQPPLGKGARGRIATPVNRSPVRNDRDFCKECGARPGGPSAKVAPTGWCAPYAGGVKTGRHRRGCLPGGRLILYASIPRLVRYFFTIRATLKVIASSNSRRSRPVSFLIFSRR